MKPDNPCLTPKLRICASDGSSQVLIGCTSLTDVPGSQLFPRETQLWRVSLEWPMAKKCRQFTSGLDREWYSPNIYKDLNLTKTCKFLSSDQSTHRSPELHAHTRLNNIVEVQWLLARNWYYVVQCSVKNSGSPSLWLGYSALPLSRHRLLCTLLQI